MLVFQTLFPDLPSTDFIIKGTGAIISCTVLENQACLLWGSDTVIRSFSLCSFANVHKLKHEFMSTSMAVYMFTMNISKVW